VEKNYGNVVNKLIESDRASTFPEGSVWIFVIILYVKCPRSILFQISILLLGAMKLMVSGSLYCHLPPSQALVPLKTFFLYCGLSRKCLFWKVMSRNILETQR